VSTRIGDLLGRALHARQDPAVVLIGFGVDEGVRRNGGRTGAAEGPRHVRQALLDLPVGEDPALWTLLARTRDTGDVPLAGDLEGDQAALGQVVADWLGRGALPVIIGGGHETAYGHFLGYVGRARPVSLLNWDAHTDVRELVDGRGHSGSPFRQAVLHESGLCRRYTVAGLLPEKILAAHVDFITAHGGGFEWKADLSAERIEPVLRSAVADGTALMVSFDLDAVDARWAPGVSAPSTGGVSPDLWLRAASAAGRRHEVASMDLVEVNPAFDPDGRTSHLAARTIREFLQGVAARCVPRVPKVFAGECSPALREVC
jgi:formiminoglutamase